MCEMHAFQLEMCAFQREMHKTANFHSNMLVSWELEPEGYQRRPVKCVHFERPLPGMVIPLVVKLYLL